MPNEAGSLYNEGNRPIDIVAKAQNAAAALKKVQDSIDANLSRVENGEIVLENTKHKGNYGEMRTDRFFERLGGILLNLNRTNDIDQAIHQGIDSVFYFPNEVPPFFIVESKYGKAQLGYTMDGRQMDRRWVEGNDRLEKAVGREMAARILSEGYQRIVSHVSPEGQVRYRRLGIESGRGTNND